MKDIDAANLRRIADLIQIKHGYDFRNYAMSSFKRRMLRLLELKKLSVDQLLGKIVGQPGFIEEFVDNLTVNVTEMFRDPGLWRVLRDQIFPALTRGPLKIWHAGCASGEEVLSMSILLREMGVYQDVSILATDLDSNILKKARQGLCQVKNMELYESNYSQIPGHRSLQNYYKVENGKAVFHKELMENISFLQHDLVTGESPAKVDLILCRNVMIYFNQDLQNDVLRKLHKSLLKNGHLAVGAKESLIWCDVATKFQLMNNEVKVYRKILGKVIHKSREGDAGNF